jgi:hypothetical protein
VSTWIIPQPTDDYCGRDLPSHTHNIADSFTCELCGAVALDLLRQEVQRLAVENANLRHQLQIADATILRLAKENNPR